MTVLSAKTLGRDITAGIVVYLVALPLCLGIALASDAPLASGLITGIIGGTIVAIASGSQTSVSGPAAGLTAVVAAQIVELGSFPAFLVAVALAGLIQIGLGLGRVGFLAVFFPSSVIKGLLAAIGVILLLKQFPHVLGHDADVEGEMGFNQPDGENSFTELISAFFDIQPGAALIGLTSMLILLGWERIPLLKKSPVPGPLVVVLYGMAVNWLFSSNGSLWTVTGEHLVQVPVGEGSEGALAFLAFPEWSTLANPSVYLAAVTIAVVASLETLLNLDAVDQIDPKQRHSPPNRELVAQGAGNVICGLIGGLPMTSVIIRSSVNIHSGNETKLSAIFHGFLLLGSILLIPEVINAIPLSALAAILFVTGLKLAKPALFRQMWREGKQQFLPFMITIGFIVFTDLLTGVLIGLGVALAFILRSNFRRPLTVFVERRVTGDVLRIELANQVSFLNRATLDKALRDVPAGGHVVLDASKTHYIDPDILDLIHDFRNKMAPAHGVQVSFHNFKDEYSQLTDGIQFVDYASRDLQRSARPEDVVEILKQGNERFLSGERLPRDLISQMEATAPGQAPLAVILSCIDSRTPAEHVFDLGIGDIFSVRIAGNVARRKVLGSIEYSCKVAGAKLIVVMGHTACGAVTSAVDLKLKQTTAKEATGCEHIDVLTSEIQKAIPPGSLPQLQDDQKPPTDYVDDVARRNVLRTIEVILNESTTIRQLVASGDVQIVGAMYDVRTGSVEFMGEAGAPSGAIAQRHEPRSTSNPPSENAVIPK